MFVFTLQGVGPECHSSHATITIILFEARLHSVYQFCGQNLELEEVIPKIRSTLKNPELLLGLFKMSAVDSCWEIPQSLHIPTSPGTPI